MSEYGMSVPSVKTHCPRPVSKLESSAAPG